ncbi:MAG: alpha/beta hydrolase [Pseudomonadota bacterium]
MRSAPVVHDNAMRIDRAGGPSLELLSRIPVRVRGAPLLFVHGAFAGAWCWEDHFLPYFAGHGHPAYAVSLRGHGGSEGAERLAFSGLDDFADDVCAAAARLPAAPLLVGHSMGGKVVERCLGRIAARGAVLMASVPPYGLGPSIWRLAAGDPGLLVGLNLVQHVNPPAGSLETARRALFSAGVPEDVVRRHAARVQGESQRVLTELTWMVPWWQARTAVPVLVLGADADTLISRADVEATARFHGTEAVRFPGMAHAMMLEPAWKSVADRILSWVQELG